MMARPAWPRRARLLRRHARPGSPRRSPGRAASRAPSAPSFRTGAHRCDSAAAARSPPRRSRSPRRRLPARPARRGRGAHVRSPAARRSASPARSSPGRALALRELGVERQVRGDLDQGEDVDRAPAPRRERLRGRHRLLGERRVLVEGDEDAGTRPPRPRASATPLAWSREAAGPDGGGSDIEQASRRSSSRPRSPGSPGRGPSRRRTLRASRSSRGRRKSDLIPPTQTLPSGLQGGFPSRSGGAPRAGASGAGESPRRGRR